MDEPICESEFFSARRETQAISRNLAKFRNAALENSDRKATVHNWISGSLMCLRDFPSDARQDAGYQLDKIQQGKHPDDFKPMPDIGKGVEEIRIWDDSGTYRVIYLARLTDAVYVLHAFQKKTQTTTKRDIDIVKIRLAELIRSKS